MTLILTALTRNYVVQVSDRLVTKANVPFDAHANKVIVYRPWDAIVTIGYTGLAVFEGRATDEWISERLWGEKLVQPAISVSREKHNKRDIGLVVKQLRDEIMRAASRIGSPEWKEFLEINISGWYYQERFARPTYVVLRKSRHSSEMSLHRAGRHWYKLQHFTICETGGWIGSDHDHFKILENNINKLGNRILTEPHLVAGSLADTIRKISENVPSVGKDLMMVHIPVPPNEVKIHYLPEHFPQIIDSQLPKYFAPCLVGTTLMSSPSETQVSYTLTSGGIPISVEIPAIPDQKPKPWSIEVQKRPF